MAVMKPCSDPGHRCRQSLEQIIPVLHCQHISKLKKKNLKCICCISFGELEFSSLVQFDMKVYGSIFFLSTLHCLRVYST